ncbi:hypothetical protein H696_05720 [Fonticula alba]|uniref:Elongation factor 1-beta n=1 Tax=Fonticula alba TaxID=691883 RepID=A0A058Z1G4_FONAL|nr:hypothetical protein H696_05720 [Fonticula alba]KCV67778.1 hypothetical protein H696_05720 [Fonticula alba]|eukprot:XP_009497809.1 hypothetical protein H696_05720 [Fonticula alba]
MANLGVVANLNKHLADKSYIEGFVATQADVQVFKAYADAPEAHNTYALRWYNHIKALNHEALPAAEKDDYLASEEAEEAEEDDFDLFGSDEEEDAEAARLRSERLAAYRAKKAAKPAVVQKSTIVLDVKPYDDTTDMVELEKLVREIQTDGLVWGAAQLIPVAFGVKKLQIMVTVEDDKVGTDFLEDQLLNIEDHVQSVDIVAFNKL